MTFVKLICAIAITSLFSGCIVVAKPSHVNTHQRKTLTLDASQLNGLDIRVGAGNLEVIGQQDTTEIIVKVGIYSDSKHKNDYELSLDERGNSAELVAKMGNTSGFWIGDSPRIDVVVVVPQTLKITIDDGSGNINIAHIHAPVAVKDGSGDIMVKDINGDVNIDDGSGEIVIANINGNLNIHDGSGSITVKDISGSASFEDGSGDLTVRKVTGVVTVDDGSGDIDIEQAGGLTILETGSGGLKVSKVTGKFEIDS